MTDERKENGGWEMKDEAAKEEVVCREQGRVEGGGAVREEAPKRGALAAGASGGTETESPVETWREVVAEMRNFACELKGNLGPKSNWIERTDRADDLLLFADRFEAAVTREVMKWAKANGELALLIDPEKIPTGNAAKCADGLRGIPDCNGCHADCVAVRQAAKGGGEK